MKRFTLLITTILLCVLVFPLGCSPSKEDKTSDPATTDIGVNVTDTLVYSSPAIDSRTLSKSDSSSQVVIRSYKDMFDLFEKLNYTPEAWRSGIREVPRVYLPLIGEKWGPTTSKEITIESKKRLFFRGLAPLILRANELIMTDRTRLDNIRSSVEKNRPLSDEDMKLMLKLAQLYKVELTDDQITSSVLNDLWVKVDIVPASLALAHAAEESGWGTSRFAAQGNAVYGQWTWGKNAIKPEQQREELGNYGIASFETLQQSVSAYMLNLNTHNAYSSLRDKRAELRKKDEKISGHILAGQLTKYSERGEEYVKGLRSMMEYNHLEPTDDAYLSDNPPIYLVPVSE